MEQLCSLLVVNTSNTSCERNTIISKWRNYMAILLFCWLKRMMYMQEVEYEGGEHNTCCLSTATYVLNFSSPVRIVWLSKPHTHTLVVKLQLMQSQLQLSHYGRESWWFATSLFENEQRLKYNDNVLHNL